MPILRQRISQTTLNWLLTILACVALLPALLFPLTAQAELRAFRLKIKDSVGGAERQVISRFDHVQYPMYRFVKQTEVVTIDQTWMCYQRSDYSTSLCPAPPQSPDANTAGGPGLQDRRPALSSPAKP